MATRQYLLGNVFPVFLGSVFSWLFVITLFSFAFGVPFGLAKIIFAATLFIPFLRSLKIGHHLGAKSLLKGEETSLALKIMLGAISPIPNIL